MSLSGCGSRVVCLGRNNTNVETLECHENAVCTLQDGRYGCHCVDGFYGDGVVTCVGR